MKSIETLVTEHVNIMRFNQAVRNACLRIIESKEVYVGDFRSMIEFIRNYADKHHHGKEEKILFAEMVAHLGQIGKNLITHGMLVEHDLARLYISELETALNEYEAQPSAGARLDIVANAVGYTKLLKRHIDKEDAIVYTYAEKNLPKEISADADERMNAMEKQAADNGTQKKYLDILAALESKYS